MAKKKSGTKSRTKQNEATHNGLGAAIGMPGAGFPYNQGSPYSEQLSNTGTIFKNLRYYLISNFRQVLSEAYVELGLIQTIVDVPVDDALRGGIEIKSKQLEEDQIEELNIAIDRGDDLQIAGQAAKWNRLFGGAGIIIMTAQDPTTPLDLAAINPDSLLEFRACDMWELFEDKQNTEGTDGDIQLGQMGQPNNGDESDYYSYYAMKVHKSRVMKIVGLNAPSFIRPRLRGWGFSVVEALVRSINQYLKATDLGFEVLDEFKLDVYKIKNLVNTLMSPNGDQKIRERVAMANWQKNFQNALVMDSEDEFDHKQLSFAGLAEAMAGIRMQIASDMRMPLTKLFGISAAGFNSGEDDIEVYNSMVESQVRNKIKYDILRMIEIRCQKLFGFIPDDLSIAFKPLRIMSSEQEMNVKTAKANILMALKTAGEITRFELREAINKGELIDISLDNAGDELNPDDPEIDDLTTAEPEEMEQTPGANKEPGEKAKSKVKGVDETKKSKLTAKDAPEVKNSADKEAQAKINKEIQAKVDELLDQAEKAEDSNNHHKAEALKKQARELRATIKNSVAYDKAAYEVDGGDSQFSDGRKPFLIDAIADVPLFEKLMERADSNWKFALWKYKQLGGKLNAS